MYASHAISNSFKTFIHLNKHRYIKEGERIKISQRTWKTWKPANEKSSSSKRYLKKKIDSELCKPTHPFTETPGFNLKKCKSEKKK